MGQEPLEFGFIHTWNKTMNVCGQAEGAEVPIAL